MARFPTPPTRDSVIADMLACEQTAGLDVLAHGRLVHDHYKALVGALEEGRLPEGDWRLPDWVRSPVLLERRLPAEVVAEYQIFHDCGKPYCLEIDDAGRRHFPGHAAMSEQVWLAVGGDPLAARLMGMDMDAHLLKAEDTAAFAARPEAATLLLTALAEIHANASMFGGTGSDSFKIKAKRLSQRGKQVVGLIETSAEG